MKKFLALILALAMALSLVACGSAPADDGDATATDEPIKIGFVNYDPTAEQYLVLDSYFQYLAEEFNITPSTFPPLSPAKPDNTFSEESLGRDFLLYLWYLSETGKVIETPDNGEFEVMLEAPLCLTGDGEDPGAGEATIKKGDSPIRGAEVKAALSVGKKLKKAKLTFTHLNQIWTGTFDADSFSFSSFALPEGEAQDRSEIFSERVEFLDTFREALIAGFRQYANAMLNGKDAETVAALREWINTRDAI